uniref:LIM zinc-binding domain-containing protein n=2 Tax=Caenorhabditis tropicalis TaxID=1561998 RepID=A0A1I7UKI0_9PELO
MDQKKKMCSSENKLEMLNCGGCKKRILQKEVKANLVVLLFNRFWHKDHIKCVYCKLPISDGRILRSKVDSSKPACYACHIQTTHPACVVCYLPVIERGLVAFDRLFHIDCFRCAICNKTIPQRTGFYERDLMLYDPSCYMLYIKDDGIDEFGTPLED